MNKRDSYRLGPDSYKSGKRILYNDPDPNWPQEPRYVGYCVDCDEQTDHDHEERECIVVLVKEIGRVRYNLEQALDDIADIKWKLRHHDH